MAQQPRLQAIAQVAWRIECHAVQARTLVSIRRVLREQCAAYRGELSASAGGCAFEPTQCGQQTLCDPGEVAA